MFGIDEIYRELLAEAKTPEEIKKVLEYQFVQGKGVPQEVLDGIFNLDPTKKKSYTRWALSQWDNFKADIIPSISNGMLKKLFDYFKERAADGLDFGKYNFKDAMNMIPVGIEDDPILQKTDDPEDPENDFDIVYRSPEWVIAVPHTYEADKKLGEGCKWCTAGYYGDNDNYWQRYSKDGPLWVNFDLRQGQTGYNRKEYPYTRYQFLFEYDGYYGKGELMDVNDIRIDFEKIQMPKSVLEFYAAQNESYPEILKDAKGPDVDVYDNEEEDGDELDSTDYMNERRQHKIIVCSTNGDTLVLLPDDGLYYDYFMEHQCLPEDCLYSLYYDHDHADTMSRFKFKLDTINLVRHDDNYIPYSFLTDNDGHRLFIVNDSYGFSIYTVKSDDMVIEIGDTICAAVLLNYRDQLAILNIYDDNIDENFPRDGSFDELEDFFINEKLSEVVGSDDTFLETAFSDGTHSLYSVANDSTFKWLIEGDSPINGKYYEAYFAKDSDDYAIIPGERMKYKFSLDTNATDIQLIEELGNKKYIVSRIFREEYCQYYQYNIYDGVNNEVMLKDWAERINRINDSNMVGISTYNDYRTYLYNIEFGQKISNDYSKISYWTSNGNSDYFIGSENNDDIEWGEGTTFIIRVDNEIRAKETEVNYFTRTIGSFVLGENMVYLLDRPLFPEPIYVEYCNDYFFPAAVIFKKKNDRAFVLMLKDGGETELLPSEYGIDARNFIGVNKERDSNIITFILLINGKNVEVEYDYALRRFTNLNAIPENIRPAVKNILFPTMAQVTESFYKILNKITPNHESDI